MMPEYIEKSFLEKCESLTFQELERYIKKCLRELDSSQLVVEDVPIRKETYLKLRELLLEKADIDTDKLLTDNNAQFEEDISIYTPSALIQNLKYSRSSLDKKLHKMLMSDKIIHHIQDKKAFERRIIWLCKRFDEMIQEQIFEERAFYESFKDDSEFQTEINKQNNIQKEIIDKIDTLITDKFDKLPKLFAKKLPWKFLPAGEWGFSDILSYCNEYQKANSYFDYDGKRLETLQLLKPTDCYVGEDDFRIYFIFCFDYTDKVILESPIRGNAMYVISGDWKEISKLSKWEIRQKYSSNVKRIIHKGEWIDRLREELQ